MPTNKHEYGGPTKREVNEEIEKLMGGLRNEKLIMRIENT
ncbi:hypothetical protein DSOL_3304 [Desulfosporosinus metallidurans]|uniref:Uncharacterized protein n=1 Tax=Desulfosporosinus metallidurans TaxID=1888891 RepID=A0A1Q8QRJ0_9FIRM|nr:hypothetical protein DSOL_3304 [Desulfosporosinus metallidurans]